MLIRLLFLLALVSLGADEPTVEPVPISYEGAFVKMIVTLIGLVVLIFFSVWLLRRIAQGRLSNFNLTKGIKILERRPLSSKSYLYLIEVRGKTLLVSESQLEVRTLATIDEPELPE